MTNTIVLIYFHPDILILIIHKILYYFFYTRQQMQLDNT